MSVGVVMLKTPSRDNGHVNGNQQVEDVNHGKEEHMKEPEKTEETQVQSQRIEVENNGTSIGEKSPKLNLNMTVNEYRSKLASRKKYDPKKEAIDVKKKHEIIDTL
ncbi:hypothetical protein RUM44_004387 [Polyplax serrata]|uniref:Uncharacterized protein n=1 Tax=Polyplax serrata TaxID=468196 RepID=A0ABR1B2Q0_POLSC